MSAGATSALLALLAEEHLDVGAGRFGLLIGAIGVGAGLGPLVLRRLLADARRPALLFGPHLLPGGVDLTLAASSSFGVALVALGAYGVGTSTGMVTYNSLLQSTVADSAAASSPSTPSSGRRPASSASVRAACWPTPSASVRCTSSAACFSSRRAPWGSPRLPAAQLRQAEKLMPP